MYIYYTSYTIYKMSKQLFDKLRISYLCGMLTGWILLVYWDKLFCYERYNLVSMKRFDPESYSEWIISDYCYFYIPFVEDFLSL